MSKEELQKELDKYISLYQNEKDHSDTLYKIILRLLEKPEPNIAYPKEWFSPPFDLTCKDKGL